MPLFFFVSGYFHKKRPFREQLTKDLERLFIPWLFFSLLLLATHIFISIVGRGLTEGVIHELGKINPLDEHCWVLYHIIWFIVCLFLVRQIYAVISITGGEILCLPLYIIGFALHYYGINLPFFIDTAFSVLIFYGAGHFFHEHQNKLFSCIGICALIFSIFRQLLY